MKTRCREDRKIGRKMTRLRRQKLKPEGRKQKKKYLEKLEKQGNQGLRCKLRRKPGVGNEVGNTVGEGT